MSRKILISFDDKGRTEVEFSGDDSRFFTKREIDRALRATLKQYRQAKREYQRERIISQLGEKKDGIEQEQSGSGSGSGSGSEQAESKRSNGTEQASAGPGDALSRAIQAKQRRNRAESARTGSREASVAAGSS